MVRDGTPWWPVVVAGGAATSPSASSIIPCFLVLFFFLFSSCFSFSSRFSSSLFFFFRSFRSFMLSLFSSPPSFSLFFSHLCPPCFYRQKQGRDMVGAATMLPPLHRPSNTWKVWVVCVFLKGKLVKTRERKNLLLPLPRSSRGRRKPIVPSKWHRFRFFFFFNEQCMKRHSFGQNALFYLNENGAKLMSKYKSILNL